ncbi:reduced folate transporter isoform X2 [Camelus dromedarius]|uniref:reduced folate transporter isoform X2 n=1 Tax=Camelus dromedarius TaxID=9838 RepID=UPI00311A690D
MKMAVCLPGPGVWDCSRCPGIRGHQVPRPLPSPAVSRRGPGGMALSGQEAEKQGPAEPRPGREPESWWCLVSYLCFYGFMAQMRPGESFITPYLLGPDKNFTQKQVTNEITPVLSYSYLAVLVPVFLLTDYLRYKPVLLLQGLSYVSVWLLLLFGSSVLHMQLMELFFSVTMAARIAYSSYVFSLVPPAHYQRVAGYSRAAVLLGVFTSSVLGQLLVTVGRVPFSTLNYVSLAFLTFSLVLALFLRRPKRSLFFNRSAPAGASPSELDQMNPGPGQPTGGRPGPAAAWRDLALARVLRELGHNLRLPQLRLWSLWWVFNSTGYYLIVYYVHILWNVVNPTMDSTRVYNGGADAASTLLDPLGGVGEAGHRGGDCGAGRAGLPHVQDGQHLAVLHGLRALPRLLPVPGAHRHFSDRVFSFSRAPCAGLRSQHIPRHCSQDDHHPHRLGQAGPGPPSPLSVPRLLHVLPGALCRLLLRGPAGGAAAPPTGHPPAPAASPGTEEPRAGEGRAGRGPGQPAARSLAPGPGGRRGGRGAGLPRAEPAA